MSLCIQLFLGFAVGWNTRERHIHTIRNVNIIKYELRKPTKVAKTMKRKRIEMKKMYECVCTNEMKKYAMVYTIRPMKGMSTSAVCFGCVCV